MFATVTEEIFLFSWPSEVDSVSGAEWKLERETLVSKYLDPILGKCGYLKDFTYVLGEGKDEVHVPVQELLGLWVKMDGM